MGRLEHVREQKTWYKGMYNYLISGYSQSQQQKLEIYQDWQCKSLHLKVNVDELRKPNMPQTTQFKLLHFEENCTVSVYNTCLYPIQLYVDISFDINKWKTSKITVHGRFVIRNISHENENYTSTFEMEFGPTKLKQTATMAKTSNLFTKTAGYLQYNSLDAEVHLIVKVSQHKR
jgi:hypothetical protein